MTLWPAIVAAAAAVACASRVAYSPPPSAAPAAPIRVEGSFDQTWQAVIQTFFDRNVPIKTLEKASGIVESDDLRGEIGRDCSCGTYLGIPVGGYGAYGGDAYYRFRVLVEPKDGGTLLTLRSTCRGRHEGVEGELVCQLVPARDEELRSAILGRLGKPGG